MDALKRMQMSKQAATNLAAGAIVSVGIGALVYFGGKAAVGTACLVGGGIAAVAVAHTATVAAITGASELVTWSREKLAEKPNLQRRDATPQAAMG